MGGALWRVRRSRETYDSPWSQDVSAGEYSCHASQTSVRVSSEKNPCDAQRRPVPRCRRRVPLVDALSCIAGFPNKHYQINQTRVDREVVRWLHISIFGVLTLCSGQSVLELVCDHDWCRQVSPSLVGTCSKGVCSGYAA